MKMFAVVALLQLCLIGNVYAGKIRHASVQYSEGVFSVEFDALVSAEQPEIYTLLTDYDHFFRLNDIIVESAVINKQSDLVKKYRLLLQACILFFCRDVVLIEDVQENGRDEVIAVVDPVLSNFSSGRSIWKILPAGAGQTSIMLRRKLEPSFWIPPLIGPWVMKNKMLQELSVMLTRLEQYASDQSGT